jgi:signal transduction histidine kinase
LRRAQTIIAERNERLARANFELTLAAKASALGQITSHLIHGLQGPVAGLRAVVSNRGGDTATDWQSAADYTERLQAIIGETVALLSDVHAQTSYELTASELGATISDRNSSLAGAKGLKLLVETHGDAVLDSHRGSLLCLIATNLIHNAVAATPSGGTVRVIFVCSEKSVTLTIVDNGAGVAPEVRDCLFQPGRSGRPGGTGLGLAISQLLARQIGAELALAETGPHGTTFRLTGPLH